MRSTAKRFVGVVLAATLVTACSMTAEQKDQLLGATIGTVLGAGTGAIAGGGDPKAIVAGAVAGGAVGWAAVRITQYHAEQTRSASQQADLLGWEPGQGMVVRINDAQAMPRMVDPGETVDVALDYAVMAPPGSGLVAVEEKWTLWKDGKLLAEVPPRREMREPGGWVARASIPVPRKARPGTYIVENSVTAGSSYDVRRADFIVNTREVRAGEVSVALLGSSSETMSIAIR